MNANDLEATGRLANSYNDGMEEITEGSYFNGDEHAFKIITLGDTMKMEYNPAEQGSRSHRSFPHFVAQAAAHTFYDGGNQPYANTILCTSDILAIKAGDASGWDWLSFCAHEFNTDDFTGEESLKQFILDPASAIISYRDKHYSKDGGAGNGVPTVPGTVQEQLFNLDCLYLGGVVTLDNNQEYSELNRETLCINNPYTFVDTLRETNDMPRVG